MSQQERIFRGERRFDNQNHNQRRGNYKSNPNRNYRQQQGFTDQYQHQATDHSVPQPQYSHGRRVSAKDRPGTYQGGSQNAPSYQPECTTSVSKYENVTNVDTNDVVLQTGPIINNDYSEKMHSSQISSEGNTNRNIDSKVQCSGSNLKSIKITGPDFAFDELLQRILETHPDRDLIVSQLVQLPNVQIEMLQNQVTQTHSLSPEATPFEYHQQSHSSEPKIAKGNTVQSQQHGSIDENCGVQEQASLPDNGETWNQASSNTDYVEASAEVAKQDIENDIQHENPDWWGEVQKDQNMEEQRNANIDVREQPRRNEGGWEGNDAVGGGRRDNRNRQRNQRRDGNKKNYKKLQETSGDLFEAPEDYSLAHCVAEDLRMGSGIAVSFRQTFKNVSELLDQKKKVGQVAVLECNNRYIYYLITKKVSNGKPFIEDLEKSLKELKKHCEEHEVKKLAMPRIGCGLDKLEWMDVKPMIEDIFSDLEIDITVYNYNADKDDSKTVKPKAKFKTVHYPLIDMETKTGLVFFGAVDGNVDECGKDLDKKFNFILDYRKERKQVGNVLLFEKKMEYLYGVVIRQKENEAFSYVNLEKCLIELRKRVKKDHTYYLGFQAFCVDDDNLTMEKFITVVRNIFYMSENDIYFCYPKELEYLLVSGEGYGNEGNINYPGGKKDFTREENGSNMFVGKSDERNKGRNESMGKMSWRTSRS